MSATILDVSDAVIRLNQGRPGPFVKINGRWHWIETRPSVLALGVAMAIPMREVNGALQEDWDTTERLQATVPRERAGSSEPLKFDDATDDIRVVRLARLYEDLAREGQLREGPLR
jgi:hypothetical protein